MAPHFIDPMRRRTKFILLASIILVVVVALIVTLLVVLIQPSTTTHDDPHRKLQFIQFFEPNNTECDPTKSIPITFIGGKIPDFSQLKEHNMTHIGSIYAEGVWAYYSGTNYTHVIGTSTIFAARACRMNDDGNYKSARYLGNLDVDLPGLSLFPGRLETRFSWPEGPEKFVDEQENNFDEVIQVSFWALTGAPVKWTIFEGQNFTGNSTCLERADGSNAFWAWGNLDFVYVGSVRQGCDDGTPHSFGQSSKTSPMVTTITT